MGCLGASDLTPVGDAQKEQENPGIGLEIPHGPVARVVSGDVFLAPVRADAGALDFRTPIRKPLNCIHWSISSGMASTTDFLVSSCAQEVPACVPIFAPYEHLYRVAGNVAPDAEDI